MAKALTWRQMQRRVAEIEAKALTVATMQRVPKPAKALALEIVALAAEILRRSNGD